MYIYNKQDDVVSPDVPWLSGIHGRRMSPLQPLRETYLCHAGVWEQGHMRDRRRLCGSRSDVLGMRRAHVSFLVDDGRRAYDGRHGHGGYGRWVWWYGRVRRRVWRRVRLLINPRKPRNARFVVRIMVPMSCNVREFMQNNLK